ncbi:S-adenosyl-L-methionine-dependent methyltransferase [Fusarium redolens]|uniref:S-adenosyl-L-methionine-dependent methyltransferase n=1 Tax=Fusarium redolens TaxID=48865 RepID=A0A9P9JS52_FUSRE|nr:S-adenosyl-L-methionine-dependent methyltransferase [Fusarium redolens]KAH7230115.1 S-adenosyl-L-methionine-dependent methyltransferase [Fusarium redolens]
MLLPAQPSILSVAHGISRKRSHSDALGREDTGTHYDRGTLHSTEQIRNDICGILDIRAKKNKPERILDDVIADDNTIHGDIATNPTTADSTRDSSITDNDPVDEGLIDDGIGDDESICSLETIRSGDIKLETLWKRKYPINEWQPHDDQRVLVWDLCHDIYSRLFKICKTSIPSTYRRVLDIGTASGRWALDFADEHPGVEVTSIDLTPLAPNYVPPNLCFQVVKSLDLQTFKKSSQDFVHLRELKGRINNWVEFAREIFDVLKPGGVAEFHERTIEFKAKAELPEDSFMKEWGDLFRKAGAERGARFDVIESGILLSSLRAAGFSDIKEYTYDVPIEHWQKQGEIGRLAWLECVCDIEGSIFRPAVKNSGWREDRCHMFAAGLRDELKKTTVKPYTTRVAVVCKKP